MSSCGPLVSSTTALQHACSLCPKRFKRRSHLVRHAATHSHARPFACRQCRSSFQRVDVLRRHELTCLLGDRAPSRKRACNFCTQQKKACVGETPCSNCRLKSIECVKSRLAEQNSHHPQGSVDLNGPSPNTFQSQDAHGSDTLVSPVSFGDARSFSDPGSSTLASDIFSFSHAGNYPWFDLFDTSGSLSEIFSSTVQAPGTYSFDFLSIFTSKTGLIQSFDCGSHRDRLKVVSAFSRNESEAVDHQSPDNTIDPNFVVNPSDLDQAKQWYSSVEEIVFTDQEFFKDRNTENDTAPLAYNSSLSEIQALQAAYLVCMYQNWEGPNSSKRRIRRYRYSTVVSVARDVGISTARHCDYRHITQHDFVWTDFIAREQLIRTFLWIFLLDHGFVIFHSLPPRMAIQEMHMHMAWPESAFQAPTAQDCFEQMQKWLQRCALSNITVYNAIRVFCKSEMTDYMVGQFADLGPLNLFAVVAAFHSLLFMQFNSFASGNCKSVHTALQNWRFAWEMYKEQIYGHQPHTIIREGEYSPGINMWKRDGFMRHSTDFWLLARVMLDRLERMLNDMPENECISVETNYMPSSLKVDQTSMQQVNELILEFYSISLY